MEEKKKEREKAEVLPVKPLGLALCPLSIPPVFLLVAIDNVYLARYRLYIHREREREKEETKRGSNFGPMPFFVCTS